MNPKEDFKCIAVDMGAGSIRVMLGMIKSGKLSDTEYHRFENRIVEHDGHERWESERIISEIITGINKIIDAHGDEISSIGIDSWGVDFALLDNNGALVDEPVAYRDARTKGMEEEWLKTMPRMETFERTGINFYIFNTLFQLLSMKGSEALAKTSRILFTPNYIYYKLTGHMRNEMTISSTSQLLGAKSASWDSQILGHIGIEATLFGEPEQPGTLIGKINHPDVLRSSIDAIQVCCHDTASAVVALPVENKNFAFISSGTWCIVGVESDTPLLSSEALESGFTNERGVDNSFRVLKNIVGLWLIQGLKKEFPDSTSHGELEKMAAEAEHTTQVINPDNELFYNPENMKSAFNDFFRKTGQDIPNDTRNYLKCAYDSLCFSFRMHIEKLEEFTGKPIEVLHLIGGGSKSDYLNQKIANVCSRQVISGPVEGASIGNILVQAMSKGVIKDLDEARELVKRSIQLKYYKPMQKLPDTDERYEIFKKLIIES